MSGRGAAATAARAAFDQGVFLTHLNRGRKLIEARRPAEARAELERALELRPRDETVLNFLGTIYFKLDMRREATAVYRTLLEIHPEADVLHANIGVLEFKEGRYDDARRRLETALLLNPGNVRPHLYLGLMDRLQGNIASCLKHLGAAGAGDLIARLGLERRAVRARAPEELLDDTADTGPMRAVASEQVAQTPEAELARALEASAGPAPLTATGRDAVFTVRPMGRSDRAATLGVVFSGAVRVKAGSVLHLQAASSSLHVGPPDRADLITLKGSGRLELSGAEEAGRVALVDLADGREVHVAPGRVLALETGVSSSSDAGSDDLARTVGQILTGALRLSGRGIAAITAGLRARALRLSEGDLLLVHPRDLVCWTGAMRARPASMGRLDQLLVPAPAGPGAVTLEGAGEVVLDLPE